MQETAMPQDAQRPVDRLISIYAESHRNPTNEVIHGPVKVRARAE